MGLSDRTAVPWPDHLSGAVQTRLAVDGLRYSQGDLRAGGARALQVCLSLEGACPTLQQLAGGRKSHSPLERTPTNLPALVFRIVHAALKRQIVFLLTASTDAWPMPLQVVSPSRTSFTTAAEYVSAWTVFAFPLNPLAGKLH